MHEDMQKGQAERLMPMLEEVLAQGGAEWRDLSAIGVGIGPGNFTGIRISVSAARGLALGLAIPAIGVSMLEALAFRIKGPVLACIDARHGNGYFQRFGYGDPGPFMSDAASFSSEIKDLQCIGTLGAKMAERLQAHHAPAAYAPACAIAYIALERMGQKTTPPAPLYLRAADAAPPRDTPRVILDDG